MDSPPISRTHPASAPAPVVKGAISPPERTRDHTRRLRILMLVEASGAGTGRHVLDLSEGLLNRGYDVHLIYNTARMDQLFSNHLARLQTLKTLAIPMRTGPHPSDVGVIQAVKRYIREHGPFDIIHGHSSKGGALARLTALRTGAAAFYTIHGLTLSDPNNPWFKRFFYRTVERGLSHLTRRIIADLVDRIDLVAEREIEHAVALLVGIEKSVVEGAGAAGLAAILGNPERYRDRKVGTVLCGGNIDTHLLANVLVRELVRCGRIARLRIAASDQPGALSAITAKFHECGVNIIEVIHHRIFTRLPAKDTVIEVECEARDAEAIERLIGRLEAAGFDVERAELD